MELRSFLRRKVVYDTPELKKVITQWLEGEGWKFKNFADFAELIGLKTPIRLSCLKKEPLKEYGGSVYSFNGVTALKNEVQIKIYFPNFRKNYPQISIKKGEKTRAFGLYSNLKQKMKPKVLLEQSNIQKNGKELSCQYSNWLDNFNSVLKLDNTHTLEVMVKIPMNSLQKVEISVQRNWKDIEQYLWSLDLTLQAEDVFHKIMYFLSFSRKDVEASREILVYYTERTDGKRKVLSQLLVREGKITR